MEDRVAMFVDSFKSFTGCESTAEASHFLSMCDGNLELAVNLYFQQQQPSSSDSPEVVFAGPSESSGYNMSNQYEMNGLPYADNEVTIDDTEPSDSQRASNGGVRSPIAPVRGPIIEQTFHQQYGTDSPHRQHPREVDRREALRDLFRPPFDIICKGDWDQVRAEANNKKMWLLVNVQDEQEFACQALNRDVWSDSTIREIIRDHFVFWQILKNSSNGVRICNYYRIQKFPVIFVVDPRTGEHLAKFESREPVTLKSKLSDFIRKYPNFDQLDRHLFENPVLKDANNETDNSLVSSTSSSSRKRAHDSDEMHIDSDSEIIDHKKSCKSPSNSPKSDVLMNNGFNQIKVDINEWQKWKGKADGKGHVLSLILRFPDETRQNIELEDTTTVQALFILIAGRGLRSHDHQLILSYPKRVITDDHSTQMLRELSFSRRELVHIERK